MEWCDLSLWIVNSLLERDCFKVGSLSFSTEAVEIYRFSFIVVLYVNL